MRTRRIAAVFYDFHKADDRWYYPRLRGHGLFCSGNGSGPDFTDRVCAFADTKVWKYRNLDGMAVWMVRGNSPDDSVLPEGDRKLQL